MVLPEGIEPTRLSASSSRPELAPYFSMVALFNRSEVESLTEFTLI